jgi:hypothetical protein
LEEYGNDNNSYDELNNQVKSTIVRNASRKRQKNQGIGIVACKDQMQAKREQKVNSREQQVDWRGSNFADTVNQFCKQFFFPRYKFLKEGWQDFRLEKKNS